MLKTQDNNKRRIYLIDKKFQVNFIMRFCILVITGGLLTILGLYLLAGKAATVSFINTKVVVKTTADYLLPILFQTVAIVVIIVGLTTIFITLRVSHKIAGPLYRFKKVLEALGMGDFSSNFKIRHLDQLQDLADEFNAMITKTRAELKTLKDSFISLKDKLDNISEQDVYEHKKAYLKELKTISQQIRDIIDHFKI